MNMTKERLQSLDAIVEVGASSWLVTIPLKEHGFYLDKQSFWDALRLRYALPLDRLPAHCVCRTSFNVEHALSCAK